MKFRFLLLLYFSIAISVFGIEVVKGQSPKLDSLKLALKSAKEDTAKCNILDAMINEEGDDSVWEPYNLQLNQIAEKNIQSLSALNPKILFFKKTLAVSLNNLGSIALTHGDMQKALEHNNKALKIQEEIGDKTGIGLSLFNIASICENQGDIPKSLEYFSRSVKIQEEIQDKIGIGASFNNIASIYQEQGDWTKALEYYAKSLKIQEEIGNKYGVAAVLNNSGMVYKYQHNYPKALEYVSKSLKIQEEVGDKNGIAASLNNIGLIYFVQNDFIKALEFYGRALKTHEANGSKKGFATCLSNISGVYHKQKNYAEAIEYAAKSLKISEEGHFPENVKNAAHKLYIYYKETGDSKLSLKNYELFILMRDSINNISTQKAAIKQAAKYEYDQKKAIEDAKHNLQIKLQEEKAQAEKRNQNIIIGSVSAVLLLVAIFSVFLYNRFKLTQKQKAIIEVKEKETQFQKHIIEEKHKEITDSINYAERIQRSFLATKQMLDENLGEYFVLFKPKDVVSGDFYWSAKLNNGNFALATADSTGHGVPGAIMSLLNITSLEKAIETETSPDKILNATRKTIIDRLKKDGSEQGGKDGMDCSLISFDRKNKKLTVANANNPVWIIKRKGEPSDPEVLEIKADKMPVGKHDRDQESFSLKTVDINDGDIVYALTDGFPDQFGGEKGKKFMSKNLRELVAKNYQLPMPEQKTLLEKAFKDWVGPLEQVDDVTIIGVKI
jgi:serine phosphatase RsbU (regulator of sigma subunit)